MHEQKMGVVHVEVEATARMVTLVRVELQLGLHGVDKDEAEKVAREKLEGQVRDLKLKEPA